MADKLSVKVRVRKNLLDDKEVKQLMDNQIKLLTSKQLAVIIGLKSDAALRKQRSSKHNSLFPYCRIGRRIFYPVDLLVKTIHKNVVDAEIR
jgi:hypothetical protein|tara:strand:+ start:241 stop:516 length:276 start_codon:yes stop_codon:yes gene_type:complete